MNSKIKTYIWLKKNVFNQGNKTFYGSGEFLLEFENLYSRGLIVF